MLILLRPRHSFVVRNYMGRFPTTRANTKHNMSGYSPHKWKQGSHDTRDHVDPNNSNGELRILSGIDTAISYMKSYSFLTLVHLHALEPPLGGPSRATAKHEGPHLPQCGLQMGAWNASCEITKEAITVRDETWVLTHYCACSTLWFRVGDWSMHRILAVISKKKSLMMWGDGKRRPCYNPNGGQCHTIQCLLQFHLHFCASSAIVKTSFLGFFRSMHLHFQCWMLSI